MLPAMTTPNVRFKCQSCGEALEAPGELLGQLMDCPTCGETVEVLPEPGHPDRSIILYRMQSLDPGIAMPELGRASVHQEGVALLGQWIAAMPMQGRKEQ